VLLSLCMPGNLTALEGRQAAAARAHDYAAATAAQHEARALRGTQVRVEQELAGAWEQVEALTAMAAALREHEVCMHDEAAHHETPTCAAKAHRTVPPSPAWRVLTLPASHAHSMEQSRSSPVWYVVSWPAGRLLVCSSIHHHFKQHTA
jgi:hypothetical protein